MYYLFAMDDALYVDRWIGRQIDRWVDGQTDRQIDEWDMIGKRYWVING